MIIVKILGGLGNQMFQFASAKALALEHNQALYLDTNSLVRHGERQFDLAHFKLVENEALSSHFGNLGMSVFAKALIKVKKHPAYYLEPHFPYQKLVLKTKDSIYLDGYFQSEKYFKNHEKIIRADFTFKRDYNDNEKKYVSLIENSNSVSLHIRRGDYITNKAASDLMEHLSLDYYYQAIQYLQDKKGDITLFIFSDDPQWVKDNLKISVPHYFVTGNNGNDSYRDMRLMSLCHHHIIANSSFSWWGAWLNAREDKRVIAPKKWFRGNKLDDRDLIPETWLRF